MNISFLQQILKSGNPQQMIMNMMTPQQKQMAQAFLNNPNREQALEQLKKDYKVSDDQINSVKNVFR
jgi:hypothetical protein